MFSCTLFLLLTGCPVLSKDSPFHISRKTDLISIELCTIVKQLTQSRFKERKNADINYYMLTSLVSL